MKKIVSLDQSSGIYVIKFNIDNYNQIQKVVLIK